MSSHELGSIGHDQLSAYTRAAEPPSSNPQFNQIGRLADELQQKAKTISESGKDPVTELARRVLFVKDPNSDRIEIRDIEPPAPTPDRMGVAPSSAQKTDRALVQLLMDIINERRKSNYDLIENKTWLIQQIFLTQFGEEGEVQVNSLSELTALPKTHPFATKLSLEHLDGLTSGHLEQIVAQLPYLQVIRYPRTWSTELVIPPQMDPKQLLELPKLYPNVERLNFMHWRYTNEAAMTATNEVIKELNNLNFVAFNRFQNSQFENERHEIIIPANASSEYFLKILTSFATRTKVTAQIAYWKYRTQFAPLFTESSFSAIVKTLLIADVIRKNKCVRDSDYLFLLLSPLRIQMLTVLKNLHFDIKIPFDSINPKEAILVNFCKLFPTTDVAQLISELDPLVAQCSSCGLDMDMLPEMVHKLKNLVILQRLHPPLNAFHRRRLAECFLDEIESLAILCPELRPSLSALPKQRPPTLKDVFESQPDVTIEAALHQYRALFAPPIPYGGVVTSLERVSRFAATLQKADHLNPAQLLWVLSASAEEVELVQHVYPAFRDQFAHPRLFLNKIFEAHPDITVEQVSNECKKMLFSPEDIARVRQVSRLIELFSALRSALASDLSVVPDNIAKVHPAFDENDWLRNKELRAYGLRALHHHVIPAVYYFNRYCGSMTVTQVLAELRSLPPSWNAMVAEFAKTYQPLLDLEAAISRGDDSSVTPAVMNSLTDEQMEICCGRMQSWRRDLQMRFIIHVLANKRLDLKTYFTKYYSGVPLVREPGRFHEKKLIDNSDSKY